MSGGFVFVPRWSVRLPAGPRPRPVGEVRYQPLFRFRLQHGQNLDPRFAVDHPQECDGHVIGNGIAGVDLVRSYLDRLHSSLLVLLMMIVSERARNNKAVQP